MDIINQVHSGANDSLECTEMFWQGGPTTKPAAVPGAYPAHTLSCQLRNSFRADGYWETPDGVAPALRAGLGLAYIRAGWRYEPEDGAVRVAASVALHFPMMAGLQKNEMPAGWGMPHIEWPLTPHSPRFKQGACWRFIPDEQNKRTNSVTGEIYRRIGMEIWNMRSALSMGTGSEVLTGLEGQGVALRYALPGMSPAAARSTLLIWLRGSATTPIREYKLKYQDLQPLPPGVLRFRERPARKQAARTKSVAKLLAFTPRKDEGRD